MGFRRINASDLIGLEIVGRTITQDPEGEDHLKIRSVHVNGFIVASQVNGKTGIKLVPEDQLLDDEWWINK
jgi:hypothetical protein